MRISPRRHRTRESRSFPQRPLPLTANKDSLTQLQKAKDGGAELVFLPIYYTEASLILQQADTMGYDPAFFGCDGMDGILNVENIDTQPCRGTDALNILLLLTQRMILL